MYRSRIAQFTMVAAVFVGIVHSNVLAEPTGSETLLVQYKLRETPSDPNSAVTWTIGLYLKEKQVDGNDVGWLIESIKISQLDSVGQPENVWTEETPTVNSSDGLWWVEHADPNDPQASEFVEPPLLESTATTEDPASADLDYYLEGVPYNPPPGGQPYVETGALNYTFTLVGSSDPEDEGEDEPVELPPPIEDPPVG